MPKLVFHFTCFDAFSIGVDSAMDKISDAAAAQIFQKLGTPNEEVWPGVKELPKSMASD